MSNRSIVHATFQMERSFGVPVETLFRAFIDPAAKRRWFVEGEGWEILEYNFDIRSGGSEGGAFRYGDGPVIRNDTVYQDVIPNSRIAFNYVMSIGDKRLSGSQATVEFFADGDKSRLIYTEQGAFFDGNTPGDREDGFNSLFDALDKELKRPSAAA